MHFRPQNTGRNAYRYIALSIKTVVIFADTGRVGDLQSLPTESSFLIQRPNAYRKVIMQPLISN